MPRAKSHLDGLPTALTYFLAHGRPPKGPATVETGTLLTFQIWGRWIERARTPGVVDELRELWTQHRDEIEQAAAPGEPWVCLALRDPDAATADENDDDENPEDEED